MTISIILILIICGLITNLMSALLGIGGGVLMVPILRTLFPELPLQIVSATSVTIVMGTAVINLYAFRKQGIKINRRSMLLWSIGMIVGVQAGFHFSFLVPDKMISYIFSSTLLLLSIKTFRAPSYKPQHNEDGTTKKDNIKGILLCILGGGIAGITGIGGGSIMAPLINQLSNVKSYQVSVYTNWMMFLGGLGSLYGYLTKIPSVTLSNSWQVGYVNFSIAGFVVLSSFVMSFFSVKIKGKLTPQLTNKSLGAILLFIAVYVFLIS